MNLRRIPLPMVGVLATATVVVVAAAIVLGPASRPSSVAVLPSASATAPPTATPVPTPTALPVLRVDGMATVAAPGALRVWSAPGGTKAKAYQPPLAAGTVVYITRGPRRVAGIDWWEIQTDYAAGVPSLFGWVHATGAASLSSLVPSTPECPGADAPIDGHAVKALGLRPLVALACFGHRELTVLGDLTCYDAAVDSVVGGASWLATNYACSLDDTFWLDGPVVSGLLVDVPGPVIGRYEVRGHFDDPEAAGCSWIPFGSSMLSPSGHPDPGAVIACRQAFVVTAVRKLE